MEEKIIRGRRVIFECEPPHGPVGSLRYTLDVFDERDNLVEVRGRVAYIAVARAAFEAACVKHPDKRIFLRKKCPRDPAL